MMKVIKNPKTSDWQKLCQRPELEQKDLNKLILEIFNEVQTYGDEALKRYTRKFDKAELQHLMVSEKEIEKAIEKVDEALKKAIELAYQNIYKFHQSQVETSQTIETTSGVFCYRENRPISKVGLYIPGGTAPLFSTVLMLGIPAKIAGCQEIVLCTPPNASGEINPTILYVANLIGITKICKIGGAQAIAALTFGTESVPHVYKIFGPGNQYVTTAKQLAQNYKVAIDMPAGPSEVLVISDTEANPEFIAADLLSQAEHGTDSQVVLLAMDESLVKKVTEQIENQLEQLDRKEIAEKVLNQSMVILFEDLDKCFEFSNLYAPEHLILALNTPEKYTPKIENAGSVFLGNYSCESAGDYASGTNHTLPTNGFAKNYSGVSVDSFVKKITFQKVTQTGIQNIGWAIEKMAQEEGLDAHKNAVTVRLNTLK